MPTATADPRPYVDADTEAPSSFLPVGMGYAPEDFDALDWLVKEARRPDQKATYAVEVGSWAGRSALRLAESGALVWCVDTWKGSVGDAVDLTEATAKKLPADEVFRIFCANVGPRLFKTVFPCRGESALWASVWPYQVDLVFIDADHRYPAVRADIKAWLPKVRPGGYICGHDHGIFSGVDEAVREAFGDDYQLAGRSVWLKRV